MTSFILENTKWLLHFVEIGNEMVTEAKIPRSLNWLEIKRQIEDWDQVDILQLRQPKLEPNGGWKIINLYDPVVSVDGSSNLLVYYTRRHTCNSLAKTDEC